MLCPICKVPLTEKKIGSAGYYVCESHGVWATIGFFSKFKGMRRVAADIFHSRRFLRQTSEHPLKCPQCFTQLKSTEYKKVPGLILEQCFNCNGIWFDKDELNAIPQKAELEGEFSYKPQTMQQRTEIPESPKIFLGERPPEDSPPTPMMYLGLPAEETTRSGAGVSAAAVLLAILCIVFSIKGFHSDEIFKAWAFYPQDPLRSNGLTLFTSLFLHGGIWHLISNIYFMYVTADNVEEVKGPWFLLVLFFAAGIVGKFLYAATDATLPSIGASAGVCGILAYYAMAFPNNRIRLLRPFAEYNATSWRQHSFSVSAQYLLIFYLITQALNYFKAQSGLFNSETNFIAHIAGLAVGLIAYVLTADHTKKN